MIEDFSTKKNAKKFWRPVEKQAYRDWVVRLLEEWKKSWKSKEELAKILSDERWKVEYAEAFTSTWRKMNKEMAEKLIQSWNRKYVKENLTKFKWLDNDVLKTLWMKWREYYLKLSKDRIKKDSCYLDDEIFNYVTPHELADIWAYTSNTWTYPYWQIDVLAYSFGSFPGLDPLEYAKKFERQVGRKHWYTIASTRELRNPIFDLIRCCKTITPEFEEYIISLWPDFEKELKERRSSGKSDGIEDEWGKIVNISKEDLMVDFVKKCRDIIWEPEEDKWEIVWDDTGLDDLVREIVWEGKAEMDEFRKMMSFFGSVNESGDYQ